MSALVIDDARIIRRIAGDYLNTLGFHVVEAENGARALEWMEADNLPELILVDWNMPEMDGLTFVRRVRSESKWAGVPILMVTTEIEEGHMQTALHEGCNDYLMKPFTRECFFDKLRLIGVLQPAYPSTAEAD